MPRAFSAHSRQNASAKSITPWADRKRSHRGAAPIAICNGGFTPARDSPSDKGSVAVNYLAPDVILRLARPDRWRPKAGGSRAAALCTGFPSAGALISFSSTQFRETNTSSS
jgi:hypothetical protein